MEINKRVKNLLELVWIDLDNEEEAKKFVDTLIKIIQKDYLKKLREDFQEEPESTLNKLFKI